MIKIGKIHREQKNDIASIKAVISGIPNSDPQPYYFSTPLQYEEYLVSEVADPFLYACILPAITCGKDIYVEDPISEELLYNIQNSIVYILANNFKKPKINIIAKSKAIKFGSYAVGCGLSLGIDSFSTLLTHLGNEQFPDYNITHFTYFNVGAHGYIDLDTARESYLKDLKLVKEFADNLKIPLVQIESNISQLYSKFDYDFDQSGHLINISTVLSFQKLFKKYLYASSYPLKDFKYSTKATGFFEGLLFPLSSTQSTELVVANPDLSRIEKTKLVSRFPISYDHLYVCWKEIILNKSPQHRISSIKDRYLNCTRCDKCLRTCAALDFIGSLQNYKSIFDLDYYYKVRDNYLFNIIIKRKESTFYNDLYELMLETNFKISKKLKLRIFLHKLGILNFIGKLRKIFK